MIYAKLKNDEVINNNNQLKLKLFISMKQKLLLFLSLFLLVGGGSVFAEDATKVTLRDLKVANGTQADWDNVANISYPLEVKDGTIFGSDDGAQATNANLDEYEYLYVTVTDFNKSRGIRIFLWDSNQNKRLDYYLYPESEKESANYTTGKDIDSNGTYCIKIPDGARLQGAKAPWTSTSTTEAYFNISEIYLTKRTKAYVPIVPYTLSYSKGKAEIPFKEENVRATGNVSVDYTTGKVTCSGSGTLTIYLNNEDLTIAKLYHVDIEGTNLEPVLKISDAVNGEIGDIYNSRFNWNIAGDAQRNTKAGAVKSFTYVFDGTKTGTMTFKSVYVLADLITAKTTKKSITELPFNEWSAKANAIGSPIGKAQYYYNNIGKKTTDPVFGFQGVEDANKYIDLTNCSKLIFKGKSDNGMVRLFYNWDGTNDGKKEVAVEGLTDENAECVFDLNDFKKKNDVSFFHLMGIKTSWGVSCNINSIEAVMYDNAIEGQGSMTSDVKCLLDNPYTSYIDATGLTNTTPITLTSANHNCIFTAKAGILANESNVAVDGTIANLALTDGYSFQAPDGVKATEAQYTRELNDKYGTVVLPFNATSNDVKFYAIKNMTDEAITLEEVTTLAAGTPAIIEKKTADAKITIIGEGNVKNAITEEAQANGDVTMHGSYTQGTTVTDENSYYIKSDKFYSINQNFICNAFRGYFTTANKAAAARLAIITDNNATGVNAVEAQEESKAIVEVYNAAGVQQKGMQKGVNIARLANGKTVTVIVK